MKKTISWYILIFFTLLGLALFISCGFLGTTIPTRSYYIISYNPQPKTPPGSLRPYPYSLEVERFFVQRIFNNQKIAYRFSPEELQYFENEQWAVRPEYMIADVIVKHLAASNICNHISSEFLDVKPDYRLEGSVEALEKYDATDVFYAHLAMSFKLVRVIDGQQVWDYSFDQRKQVYQKKMVFTIMAFSSIMQTQMDIVVNQLDAYFLSLEKGEKRSPQETRPEKNFKPVTAEPETTSVPAERGYEIIPEKKIKRK
ncbi:MAG: ABC-type transport auxiliary lipoprotein family protein [Candidatus Latescibacter sp.]|nr:ABC-type transport auxiliary lipoprotein family protein [Candidatus Latescibacter sp.]